MRSLAWALLLVGLLALTSGRQPDRRVIEVSTTDGLLAACREPLENVTIRLAPGNYLLAPTPGSDRIVGCDGVVSEIPVTTGLVVTGHNVHLAGPSTGEATIITDADYKVHFRDCIDCDAGHLIVTGSDADTLRDANDAAVVVSKGSVRIANCSIRSSLSAASMHDPSLGGDGICGRDAAKLTIEFNEIYYRWGIVLQKGVRAVVRHNLIEGSVPNSGAAMVVMCDAFANVERNHFRDFEEGLLLVGRPSLVCRANVIEKMAGNGIAATGVGLGRVLIEQNVLYRCGAAGIAVRADGDQRATRNMIVATGQTHPKASAVQVYGARAEPAVHKNTLYDNTVLDEALDRDAPREIFWRVRRPWTRTYRNTPVGVDGRHKFYESAFLTRYGRWSN